jgi:hypothetical protein
MALKKHCDSKKKFRNSDALIPTLKNNDPGSG